MSGVINNKNLTYLKKNAIMVDEIDKSRAEVYMALLNSEKPGVKAYLFAVLFRRFGYKYVGSEQK